VRSVSDLLSGFFANPIVSTAIVAIGVAAIGLWLAAAWWAYADATVRTESSLAAVLAAGWIVLSTPVLLPLALGVYRAVRPQQAAAESRATRVALDLAVATIAPACPHCAARIDPDWRRCPSCATWLAAPCRQCGGWSDPAFDICPLCGSDDHAEPTVIEPPFAEHGTTAAAGWPAAVVIAAPVGDQRGVRMSASSVRPRSYAASRDSLSASS
jgi:RNA polymerase subunit RPABC4/transcription elongation factor Spt4